MKLETKFQKVLFFPYVLGTIITIIAVSIILFKFSYEKLDDKTKESIIESEEYFSEVTLYSVHTLLSRFLSKSQLILEESINSYLNLADSIKDLDQTNETFITGCLMDNLIANGYQLNVSYDTTMIGKRPPEEVGFWFINQQIYTYEHLNNIDLISEEQSLIVKKQIVLFSQLIHTLYSIQSVNNDTLSNLYFLFDSTELFLGFPLSHSIRESGLISAFGNYENPNWCKISNETATPHYYYFKCREYYITLLETAEKNPDQTIFVLSPYNSMGAGYLESTQCIKFTDTISNGMAFLCSDNIPNMIFESFDRLNNQLRGHFLISATNIHKPFYFPNIIQCNTNMLLSSYEYNGNENYYLEELIDFNVNITNIMTKEYIDKIHEDSDNPLQFFKSLPKSNYVSHFSKNGIIYNFTIFPFVVQYNNELFHVLSIVYVFQEQMFFTHMYSYQERFELKLYLELFLFIFFGISMTVLVWTTFISLAKYIVIPIKNVQYMLKGINIGGENRLEYLESLKTNKEGDILNTQTQAQGMTFIKEEETNALNNNNNVYTSSLSDDNNTNSNNNNLLFNELKSDENEQYDQEGDNIEKELHFYDFDEELLQYRPREINGLVNVLLDLKKVLILTSNSNDTSKGKEKIIDYSMSQNIFENVKNKEGSFICQSNIGNLSSLCAYYDKAIFHLCLSLQVPKLKKFLSKTINDELDVSGSLLHLIDSQYNKNFPKEITNQLVKKQQNSSHKTYSQKAIGNLINNRYNKLIQIYFSFFSMLKKSKRKYEDLSGLYLNTQYHTISYFHKILIQYVYLCYVSNDLIKIGESILDYIEFLLKFKLSTKNKKDLLNKNLSNIPYYKNVQEIKLKAFDKIVQWFDLFEHYITHVNENTTLGNDKSIIDTYTNNGGSSSNETHNNQSAFQFRVHIQRGNFLKGKFALICKDYSDAVFFFANAARKDLLVYDGLIKKRALDHLQKLVYKLEGKIKKSYQYYGNTSGNIVTNNMNNYYTNMAEVANTKNEIEKDLAVLRVKRSKDVIVIIDRGHIIENSDYDSYVDEAKNILKNYIGINDRFGMFVFDWKFRILCPIKGKKDIDYNQIVSYLNTYSMDYVNNNYDQTSEGMTVEEVISSINYCVNYLLVKMVENNEKYFIYFTNVFSTEENFKIFERMKKEKNINVIIVGKFYEGFEITTEISELIEECGKKSEFVDFGNMKRIKNIFSCSNTINDPVIFPNEIYESTSK